MSKSTLAMAAVIVLAGISSIHAQAFEQGEGSRAPKKWTYMFYDDADFVGGYDPLADFAAEAFSGDNLDVVILQDTSADEGKIWYLDENQNLVLRELWGEVDMGAELTLRDFINYCKANYPAEHYFLAVYDHGNGWRGCCVDDTNFGWLYMEEMQVALAGAGGVDILAFTAPCHMGALESAYELRDLADVYIGSEEVSGYNLWKAVVSDVCDLLNGTAPLTSYQIAEEIVQLIADNPLPSSYKDDLTMSATRPDKLAQVIADWDALCKDLIPSMGEYIDDLWEARKKVKRYGLSPSDIIGYIDAYDYAYQFSLLETDPDILDDLSSIMQSFDEAIIAEWHGRRAEGSHGLSVYFPLEELVYSPAYETRQLDFVDDTDWVSFLKTYYAGISQQGEIYVDDDAPASWYDLTHVKTIEEGLSRVAPGGTVHVYSGNYEESVYIKESVNLIGEGRESTRIIGDTSFIMLINAGETTISGFTIKHQGVTGLAGVYISGGDSFSVTDNRFEASCGDAMRIYNADDGLVTRNIIEGCDRGVHLTSSSMNNLFYHNNFFGNVVQAYDEGANSWSGGYPVGGNHWDDYTGSDVDCDGIGDDPYLLAGGSQDDHPLMLPFNGFISLSHALSAGTGGEIAFLLDAGNTNAHRNYIVLASVTGTSPGTPLPGGMANLPLNMDVFTDIVLGNLSSPVFTGFLGALDGSGEASAVLNTFGPLPPSAVGVKIFFAYALNNLFDYSSNPVIIEVVN